MTDLVRRLSRPLLVEIRDLLVVTYTEWRNTRTIRLGAGLAYYGLFSLTSVVAVAFAMFRIVGRSQAFEDAIAQRFEQLADTDVGASIDSMFEQLRGSAGTQLGLIGLGSLLVTGSLFFVALEDALNQIWHVPVSPGLRSSVRRRLISLVVLLGAAATLVVSIGVQAASSLLALVLPEAAPGVPALASLVTSGLSWTVLAGAVTLLFRYLPRAEVRWRQALTAAATTSVFLVVGTALIGWYLRTVGAGSIGGVVSSPIVILLWIYYEAQILLAGAHLAHAMGLATTAAPPRRPDDTSTGDETARSATTGTTGDVTAAE